MRRSTLTRVEVLKDIIAWADGQGERYESSG
jgi:hypothetical protein